MSDVAASVIVLPKNSSYTFVDGWDFKVSEFTFRKKSDHELEVTFVFQTELVREDEVFGIVQEFPHSLNENLLEKEYELDVLLDVITLHTGAGLRIDPVTYKFTHPRGTSSATRAHTLNITDLESIQKRFMRTKELGDGLQDALRFYRLNRLEEDGGERCTQLWNIIERLYGKQPNTKFLNVEESKILKEYITQSADIKEDKKIKLIEGIQAINPVNTLDLLADRIRLNDSSGPLTEDQKKKLLRGWKKLRGYQGHGEYVLRSEGLKDVLEDLEDTVELLLEENVRPKMYLVVIFQDGSLHDSWKNSPSHSVVGKWNFTPVRGSRLADEIRILEHVVMRNKSAYVIDYKSVFEVSSKVSRACELPELDQELALEIAKLQHGMDSGL